MNVLIDADACPVVSIAVSLCTAYQIPCYLLCDTAHRIEHTGAVTLVCDKGADSVDFAIANRVKSGDLVITQDYGVASMCLAKNACVLHQDGWTYTNENIDALLFQRHESRQYRASGGRTKGPKKRTSAQDAAFQQSLEQMLQKALHG
ncbi:MAG: YaiI/YqxD family protein [Ruminococcaceae bacterium]|nr:YaiI/YqxD family protein [Oscillospiraceae bacterium]